MERLSRAFSIWVMAMQILIDGDGCPVVDKTISLANEYHLPCAIFCDTAHQFQRPGVKTVVVDQGADSVDFALVNQLRAGDILVTQDYGLAAMGLARGAVPIRQDGLIYSNDNIDALLTVRHTAKKIRSSGGRLKGPSKRRPEDNAAFEAALRLLLDDIFSKKET